MFKLKYLEGNNISVYVHHFWVGVALMAVGTAGGLFLIFHDIMAHKEIGCPQETIGAFADCGKVVK